MFAAFNDTPLIHHKDQVGILYRRPTVRDDEGRAPCTRHTESGLYLLLSPAIQRAGGFV
jgi:hypothetical protein